MAFDYKKEYKEFYLPKNKPQVVKIPPMNYVAVRGKGDPNEEGGAYKRAIGLLYAVAYTLRMSAKSGHKIQGFFEYVVPPLEGFWWKEGRAGVDFERKQDFCWISMIRLPEFITREDFDWAVEEVAGKKGIDSTPAEFLTVEEGWCVQMMHLGPFDEEPESLMKMQAYLAENGWEEDFASGRLHHEIYLSDARKVPPEKWRTVLRHPIRKKNGE